jgi:hypothetical protein
MSITACGTEGGRYYFSRYILQRSLTIVLHKTEATVQSYIILATILSFVDWETTSLDRTEKISVTVIEKITVSNSNYSRMTSFYFLFLSFDI